MSSTTGPSPGSSSSATSTPASGGGSVAAPSASAYQAPPPAKRTRVLLSCHACRTSKLKCDRQAPCGQCVKKGRPDGCAYAPRPERPGRQARGMAARLRRLEGMVRGMLDENGADLPPAAVAAAAAAAALAGGGGDGGGGAPGSGGLGVYGTGGAAGAMSGAADSGGKAASGHQQKHQQQQQQQHLKQQQQNGHGEGVRGCGGQSGSSAGQSVGEKNEVKIQVVQGTQSTSYVGGTHFMAILEDIDELKSYFDYPDEEEGDDMGGADQYESAGSPEHFLLSQSGPRNKQELLSLLPERIVTDRLMMRYFSSNSPSQHILHRPTFSKEYVQFWQDPSAVSYDWIAQLFMVSALGLFFNSFQAPHELEGDSPTPMLDRFRLYRGAAGTALMWGKYSQPSQQTLQAMLLYVEGEFLVNRQSQMNCYLLSSTLIRLMLKMGLHRDPSKLPNISVYDGEMRRRVWNLAIQLDLLVAFHLGLPAMINGIESDTTLPRNLLDTDFDVHTQKLPPTRPVAEYTHMTYPINKAALCRVFGLVARQAHSLTRPTYADVMKLDAIVDETYGNLPQVMKTKPLDESIIDPPIQTVQRYGLANLYQKSRCVLHRRYITEAVPREEHTYSRKTGLSAALSLLGYQNTMYEACKPGAILHNHGWFLASLAINDFLLADVILAIVIQSEHYWTDGGGDWIAEVTSTPTKDGLLQILRRSRYIWDQMALHVPDCKKAFEFVDTVTRKIETQMGITPDSVTSNPPSDNTLAQVYGDPGLLAGLTIQGYGDDADIAGMDLGGGNAEPSKDDEMFSFFRYPHPKNVFNQAAADASWDPGYMDWNGFDNFTRSGPDQSFQMPNQPWLDRNPLEDLDFVSSTSWDPTTQI